jgi:hypothetical protein
VGRARLEDLRADEDSEQTVFGGDLVTNAVAAHPGPAAAVLFAGAGVWFLRAGGVVGALQDPQWTYGLVGLDLLLALLLLLNRGPARQLAQVGLVLQLLATAWLAREAPLAPVHLAYLGFAGVALGMLVGEPGPVRRYVGLGLGLGAAVLAALLLTRPVAGAESPADRQLLVGRELGYELELPPGFALLGREQLGLHLALPSPTLNGGGVGFGDSAQGRYGMLWVERGPGQKLAAGCQALLGSLGGTGEPRPLSRPAPAAMGRQSLVYALRTPEGARGALGCGLLGDGRLVGLAVVAVSAEEGRGESSFQAVGEGLTLR